MLCNPVVRCLSFAPHPIGSHVKGSRQLAAEGLTAINYQLLALRCSQRSLVGNGFIRSVVMVSSAPTGRDTAIYVFVQCECASKCLPLAELEGKMPLAADEV